MLWCFGLIASAIAQERVIWTAMPLEEAEQRFSVRVPSGRAAPIQAVNADRTRYAGVHFQDQRGGIIEIGSLTNADDPPVRVDVSPRQGLRVVGFIGGQSVVIEAWQTGRPSLLGAVITGDRVVDLEFPNLAEPNTRVLRRALVIQHDAHGPWIAAMTVSVRQGFDGAETILTVGRFDLAGSADRIREIRLARMLPGLDRPDRAIQWIDPERVAVVLSGSPRLWMHGRGDVLTWVRWEDPEMVAPAVQPVERFLTIGPGSPHDPGPSQGYGVTLTNGTIIGAFTSSDTARIRVWRTPRDPEEPGVPDTEIATDIPLWLVHPHDPHRARKVVIDCGEDVLLIGASLLHNGIPNEILGFVDLRLERPVFTPLLAGNNIITLGAGQSATARRRDDGSIDLLLTLSATYGRHMLLPIRPDGSLEPR